MTRIFEGREFFGGDFGDPGFPWTLRPHARVVEALEFRRCTFLGCSIVPPRKTALRSTVRHVSFVDCKQHGCAVYAAIVEDVLVDGMKCGNCLHTWGAVFKHVTLRGRIGQLLLSNCVTPLEPHSPEQGAFDEANAAYYLGVDWALDIREAEFMDDPDLRGVPGRLVHRDPATSVLITRAKAAEGRWRQLDLTRTYWPTALTFFLELTALDSTVLVAPQRAPSHAGLWTRQSLLDGLQRLRDAGIAEPD